MHWSGLRVNVEVQTNPQDGLQLIEEEERWGSFVYTKNERCPAFTYDLRKTSAESVRFLTVVAPHEEKRLRIFPAKNAGNLKLGFPNLKLDVSVGRRNKILTYNLKK